MMPQKNCCQQDERWINSHQRIQFGENVEGYALPVLNEREIRAAAGIMFLLLLSAFVMIQFKQDFLPVKYVILVFLTDFILRVFVSPRFAPLLITGGIIVSRQVPEYVSAPPKKFAWKIGLTLSGLMFILLVVVNSYSAITFGCCAACLLFLFVESSFGICLGCLVYPLFYKKEALLCAGEICAPRRKEVIQKISWTQVAIVFASVAFILLTILFFNNYLRVAPKHLKEVIGFR